MGTNEERKRAHLSGMQEVFSSTTLSILLETKRIRKNSKERKESERDVRFYSEISSFRDEGEELELEFGDAEKLFCHACLLGSQMDRFQKP